MDPAPFVRAIENGAALDVFVQPRAKLIARALDIAPSRASVVGGFRSRSKQIAVRDVGVAEVKEAIGHVLSSRAHESG